MTWNGFTGFLRDASLALGIAIIAWLIYFMLLAPSPQSSGPAPSFALNNLQGQEVTLEQHEGLVVLNFWFTSCPPCRHEIPELVAFHDAHPEVALYGVSVDRMDTNQLRARSRKLGIDYTVLHDNQSRVAQRYGVSLFPTTIAIHDGQIVHVTMGEVSKSSLERSLATWL